MRYDVVKGKAYGRTAWLEGLPVPRRNICKNPVNHRGGTSRKRSREGARGNRVSLIAPLCTPHLTERAPMNNNKEERKHTNAAGENVACRCDAQCHKRRIEPFPGQRGPNRTTLTMPYAISPLPLSLSQALPIYRIILKGCPSVLNTQASKLAIST